ncbi:MAG: selenocysteine-specific translation elongation factor [Pseudomonadales bacterium]|jgi:selenocysteine-specific elongation factor
MIIATAGHVDHGKTLLVKSLTGIETDRLDEEKDRGLTIDLGFAYIDDELGGRLGFIDVPGHIKFINNMLAGVGAIDFALLVIAADDGPMPQTLEHLAILDQLGISTGAIALTKIDRVDEDRVSEVEAEITNMLRNTSLADISIYPLSSITGEGVDDLKTTLCLMASEIDAKSTTGYFRLAIDRCFSVKGSGLVVTGSVFHGEIREGQELYLTPQGEVVRIRKIHTQNQAANTAKAGDRCALNIATNNIGREDISRGNWLTNNPFHRASKRFDIDLKVLKTEGKPLRHWTPVHIHSAANHVTGRIAVLESQTLKPGERGLVQVVTNEAINLCFNDRVIIRDQAASRTIAGGNVIDPFSPARGRSTPGRLSLLNDLRNKNAQGALIAMLEHYSNGLDVDTCYAALNLTTDELRSLLQGQAVELNDKVIISNSNLELLKNDLSKHFDDWHKSNPQEKGLSLNQLKKLLPPHCLVADIAISQLVDADEIVKYGNILQRPGYSAQISPQTEALWAKVEPILISSKTKPPVLHDLAAQLSMQVKALEKSLAECVKTGLLVRPIPNRYFLPSTIAELRALLSKAAIQDTTDSSEFTVKEYRDVTGIGRNLCIEILEYFDRLGLTQRIGDKRKINTER